MKKHWLLIALASLLLGGEVSRKGTATHTHTSRLARGGVLLVALVVSLGMFVSSTDHAKAQAGAQIDISGDWTFTVLAGGPFLDCAATITQAGTGLSMAMDCTSSQGFQGGPISFHSRDLRGTIDTATGDISMSGTLTAAVGGPNPLALDVRGTASPDGNSMSGSFTSIGEGGPSGTFTGVRQLAAPPAATVAAAAPESTAAPTAAAALPSTGSAPAGSGDSTGLWAALIAAAGAAVLAGGLALRRRA